MKKPHTQIGQKGKGKGRLKPKKPKYPKGPPPTGPKPPPGLPKTNPPEFMPFPNMPDAPPNFLPNTPGFEHAQTDINDQLMAAMTAYSTGGRMIPAVGGLSLARLGTDEGFARDRLMEDLAGRGITGSSDANYLMNRDVQVPFGRGRQDIGLNMAGQYADLGSQYGGSLLSGQRSLYDALNQRANDAYSAGPLGSSLGHYQVPGLPDFTPIYNPPARGGKTRPKGGK